MSKLDKKRRRHKLRQKKNSKVMKKAKLRDKVTAKLEAEEEAKPKMSDKKGVVHSTAKKDYSQSDTSKPGIDRSIWGLKDE